MSLYATGRVDGLMLMATICQEFGWTYQEYKCQPKFFIDLIREKMLRDIKRQELEMRKLKRG